MSKRFPPAAHATPWRLAAALFCLLVTSHASAATLAERNPGATRAEIRHELVGNLCRCTGYQAIVDAVEDYLHLPAGSRTEVEPGPHQASRAEIPKSGQTIAGAAPEPVADPVSGPVAEGGTA